MAQRKPGRWKIFADETSDPNHRCLMKFCMNKVASFRKRNSLINNYSETFRSRGWGGVNIFYSRKLSHSIFIIDANEYIISRAVSSDTGFLLLIYKLYNFVRVKIHVCFIRFTWTPLEWCKQFTLIWRIKPTCPIQPHCILAGSYVLCWLVLRLDANILSWVWKMFSYFSESFSTISCEIFKFYLVRIKVV